MDFSVNTFLLQDNFQSAEIGVGKRARSDGVDQQFAGMGDLEYAGAEGGDDRGGKGLARVDRIDWQEADDGPQKVGRPAEVRNKSKIGTKRPGRVGVFQGDGAGVRHCGNCSVGLSSDCIEGPLFVQQE